MPKYIVKCNVQVVIEASDIEQLYDAADALTFKDLSDRQQYLEITSFTVEGSFNQLIPDFQAAQLLGN